MILEKDVRDKILDFLSQRGIMQSRIAALCGIHNSTIYNILAKRKPLSNDRLAIINEFLGTDFKPTPEPEKEPT